MHVYLALLDETKQYDYALDEYDLITYSPERIVENAGESIPINSNEFWMDFLETGDYAQYVDEEWTALDEAGNFGTDQQSSSGNAKTNFRTMEGEYVFSRGAGAWATIINLKSDGSFTGEYHDSDAGDTGDGYANGTRYICNFHGNFSSLDQIDSYSYSMRLESLEMENEPGTVYYENNMRYICVEPYGFDEASDFVIYTPGMQIASLPEEFVIWLSGVINIQDTSTLPCYGIYNVNGKMGFVKYE